MSVLPEITKAKASSTPSFLEDSGLELRGSTLSRPSTAGSSAPGSGSGWTGKSPSGYARFTPSPPPGGPTRAKTSLSRKSLDYVWVSKSELKRKEVSLESLRAEIVQMQSQIRNLQHYEQDLTLLQSGCGRAAEALGCTVEGVAASAVQDILLTRINDLVGEHQRASQEGDKCRSELEHCQGELAAASVSLSSVQGQLMQTTKKREHLDSTLKQTKVELESSRQTCARTGATMESLRQQLTEVQGKVGRSQRDASFEVTQLQTDMGRLKKELTEKDDQVTGWREQCSVVEKERDSLEERLAESESLHAELCMQLTLTLKLDSTGSFDLDYLLSQVGVVMEEHEELSQHCSRLSESIKMAELDSKASRETILRLVAVGKEHSKDREELAKLQTRVVGEKASLVASEQERVVLREQLTAAEETVGGLEQALVVKEERLSELCRNLDRCKLASDSNKSLVDSVHLKHEELVSGLRAVLSDQSLDDGGILHAVDDLRQTCCEHSTKLEEQSAELARRDAAIKSLESSCLEAERCLVKERAKLSKMEGEVASLTVVCDGLTEDLEKCHRFSRKVSKAVALDTGTAAILNDGDFAHDAILMKAEQLVKLESEALLIKQTAVYALQRKLKACRQALQSKELHMGLLQRKTESLEHRLKTAGHKKTEWEAAVSKVTKLEKQLERMQGKVGEQRETISRLESDSNHLHRLKECCRQLEREKDSLMANKGELDRTCGKLSQELAEARQEAKKRKSKEAKEMDTLRTELETQRASMEGSRKEQEKLCVFRTAVQRLLSSQEPEEGSAGTSDDYDAIASLEKLIGSQRRYQDNARCLEASLRQLEKGFKTGYNDTLTILGSE